MAENRKYKKEGLNTTLLKNIGLFEKNFWGTIHLVPGYIECILLLLVILSPSLHIGEKRRKGGQEKRPNGGHLDYK